MNISDVSCLVLETLTVDMPPFLLNMIALTGTLVVLIPLSKS